MQLFRLLLQNWYLPSESHQFLHHKVGRAAEECKWLRAQGHQAGGKGDEWDSHPIFLITLPSTEIS